MQGVKEEKKKVSAETNKAVEKRTGMTTTEYVSTILERK